MPAGQIQHAHAGPQLQQPPGQLRGGFTRDTCTGDGRPVGRELAGPLGGGKEVQIILVVHLRRVEQVAHASEH